jgi:glycosyltransferase involved in cell wall biosynthesis
MLPPSLSLVIPVFNEASILEPAATELLQALSNRGWEFEVIFAQNGSEDETLEVLEHLSLSDRRFQWISVPTANPGEALRRGILRCQGEQILCDDINGFDPAFYDEALPLLEQEGVDMVVGSRAAVGATDSRSWIKRCANRMHNRVLRWTLGFSGTDALGPKAFRREPFLPLVRDCVIDGELFSSELILRAQRAGLGVREIPITHREKRNRPARLITRSAKALRDVAKLRRALRDKE